MWAIELGFSASDARLARRAAHRQRLFDLHDHGLVPMAGPFADDSGALIIIDVPTRDDLDALMQQDPYFSTQGVTVRSIRQWEPFIVPADDHASSNNL